MPTRLAELGSGITPLPPPDGTPAWPTHTRPGTRLDVLRDWLAAAQATPTAREPRRARLLHVGAGPGCPAAAAELAQLSTRDVPGTVGDADELATGAALADAEVDGGTDLVVLSVPGAEIVGPALICVVTGIEPVKLLPRGARLDAAEWTRRAAAVRDARRALAGAAADPDALLAAAGNEAVVPTTPSGAAASRLALACGLLLQATARRTPVVLDGLGAAAVGTLCAQAVPAAATWWRAAEVGDDPACDAAMAHLAVEPVLPMPGGGPAGVAGALAVLTLRMAVRAVAS